jgi:hypothetical protein
MGTSSSDGATLLSVTQDGDGYRATVPGAVRLSQIRLARHRAVHA